MKKIVLVVGVLIGIVLVAGVVMLSRNRARDKALSPESRVTLTDDEVSVGIIYCRPYKRGRQIFGGLVPYGQLWRTGANEATVFSTSTDIQMNGQKLESGRYQLVTIPNPDKWTIILNSDIPGWGIEQSTGKTYHNTEADVLVFEVPVEKTNNPLEQFTISLNKEDEKISMALQWDSTRVRFPIKKLN